MDSLDLIFLGTGGAWPVPELSCDCRICREMRAKQQQRKRTALLLCGESNLLIDCGPDIADQLALERLGQGDARIVGSHRVPTQAEQVEVGLHGLLDKPNHVQALDNRLTQRTRAHEPDQNNDHTQTLHLTDLLYLIGRMRT